MKSKRRLIGNISITVGLILLLGAGGLFFFNMLENNSFDEDSFDLAEQVRSEMEHTDESIEGSVPEETDKVELTELKTRKIGDGVFDGILAIPAIELEMSVYDTWNDEYLRKSICRYYGSPYTDDFVIAGHNYRSGFGKLKKLKTGDEVFFTDMDGVTTRYIVKQLEVLNGTDISGMLSGEWPLSLYTCTYGGSARLTVRCEKA